MSNKEITYDYEELYFIYSQYGEQTMRDMLPELYLAFLAMKEERE